MSSRPINPTSIHYFPPLTGISIHAQGNHSVLGSYELTFPNCVEPDKVYGIFMRCPKHVTFHTKISNTSPIFYAEIKRNQNQLSGYVQSSWCDNTTNKIASRLAQILHNEMTPPYIHWKPLLPVKQIDSLELLEKKAGRPFSRFQCRPLKKHPFSSQLHQIRGLKRFTVIDSKTTFFQTDHARYFHIYDPSSKRQKHRHKTISESTANLINDTGKYKSHPIAIPFKLRGKPGWIATGMRWRMIEFRRLGTKEYFCLRNENKSSDTPRSLLCLPPHYLISVGGSTLNIWNLKSEKCILHNYIKGNFLEVQQLPNRSNSSSSRYSFVVSSKTCLMICEFSPFSQKTKILRYLELKTDAWPKIAVFPSGKIAVGVLRDQTSFIDIYDDQGIVQSIPIVKGKGNTLSFNQLKYLKNGKLAFTYEGRSINEHFNENKKDWRKFGESLHFLTLFKNEFHLDQYRLCSLGRLRNNLLLFDEASERRLWIYRIDHFSSGELNAFAFTETAKSSNQINSTHSNPLPNPVSSLEKEPISTQKQQILPSSQSTLSNTKIQETTTAELSEAQSNRIEPPNQWTLSNTKIQETATAELREVQSNRIEALNEKFCESISKVIDSFLPRFDFKFVKLNECWLNPSQFNNLKRFTIIDDKITLYEQQNTLICTFPGKESPYSQVQQFDHFAKGGYTSNPIKLNEEWIAGGTADGSILYLNIKTKQQYDSQAKHDGSVTSLLPVFTSSLSANNCIISIGGSQIKIWGSPDKPPAKYQYKKVKECGPLIEGALLFAKAESPTAYFVASSHKELIIHQLHAAKRRMKVLSSFPIHSDIPPKITVNRDGEIAVGVSRNQQLWIDIYNRNGLIKSLPLLKNSEFLFVFEQLQFLQNGKLAFTYQLNELRDASEESEARSMYLITFMDNNRFQLYNAPLFKGPIDSNSKFLFQEQQDGKVQVYYSQKHLTRFGFLKPEESYRYVGSNYSSFFPH